MDREEVGKMLVLACTAMDGEIAEQAWAYWLRWSADVSEFVRVTDALGVTARRRAGYMLNLSVYISLWPENHEAAAREHIKVMYRDFHVDAREPSLMDRWKPDLAITGSGLRHRLEEKYGIGAGLKPLKGGQ